MGEEMLMNTSYRSVYFVIFLMFWVTGSAYAVPKPSPITQAAAKACVSQKSDVKNTVWCPLSANGDAVTLPSQTFASFSPFGSMDAMSSVSSSDGRYLALYIQNRHDIYDLQTRKLVFRVDEPSSRYFALSDDGKWYVNVTRERVRVWEVATKKVVHDFTSDEFKQLYTIALSGDGNTLLSLHRKGVVKQWALASQKAKVLPAVSSRVRNIAINASGRLAMVGTRSGFSLIDLSSNKVMLEKGINYSIPSFHPTKNVLYYHVDKHWHIYDIDKKIDIARIPQNSLRAQVVTGEDGAEQLLFWGEGDYYLWDVSTQKPVASADGRGLVTYAAYYQPELHRLLAYGDTQTVNRSLIGLPLTPKAPILGSKVSSQGIKKMAIAGDYLLASSHESIYVWNKKTHTLLHRIPTTDENPWVVARDKQAIYSFTRRQQIQQHNVADGSLVSSTKVTLPQPMHDAVGIAVNADGSLVAVRQKTGNVYLFDQQGALLTTITLQKPEAVSKWAQDRAQQVLFSADGQHVYANYFGLQVFDLKGNRIHHIAQPWKGGKVKRNKKFMTFTPSYMELSPTNNRLLLSFQSRQGVFAQVVIDLKTMEIAKQVNFIRNYSLATFGETAQQLITANRNRRAFTAYELQTIDYATKPEQFVHIKGSVGPAIYNTQITFDRDAKRLYVNGVRGVEAIDLDKGEIAAQYVVDNGQWWSYANGRLRRGMPSDIGFITYTKLGKDNKAVVLSDESSDKKN